MIMKITCKKISAITIGLLCLTTFNSAFSADSFTDVFTSGKAYVDLHLRFETVDQDNALADADGLTLRTRLGYRTAELIGLSAVIEVEDSRAVFGVDDFSVPATGFNVGEFSVIADPESTEIDQAFVQYKVAKFSGKLGRQVITLDNHRFVGHVGWRQDRQTFDGVSVVYQASESVSLHASRLSKRNRIFAQEKDIDSNDTLLNLSYKIGLGKLTAYAYFLEQDVAGPNSNDTFGIRFNGSSKLDDRPLIYAVEFATQQVNDSIDADYFKIEGGSEFSGVTAKIGIESLGSDNGRSAFSTPLATLHKFNGWTDQFLGTPKQGLEDIYFSLSGKLAGGKWSAIYHDFSTDVATAGDDDLGDEIDLLYSRKFGDNYYAGAKYGDYSAGDAAFSKVDTSKFWLWAGAKF
ncbi:MAG: hypothetical protein ACJAQ6_001393 [Arenicella sp.]|jgi:hypothetical protein